MLAMRGARGAGQGVQSGIVPELRSKRPSRQLYARRKQPYLPRRSRETRKLRRESARARPPQGCLLSRTTIPNKDPRLPASSSPGRPDDDAAAHSQIRSIGDTP